MSEFLPTLEKLLVISNERIKQIKPKLD